MIPLASVFLMIPMYLMSVCIESYLATTMIVNVDTAKIWKWMWKANAFSYLLIIFIISLSIPFSNFAIKSYLFIDPVINVFIEAVSIVARLFN